MANFDYDKIKDMEYNSDRGRYVGKDGSGYKYNRYDRGEIWKNLINLKSMGTLIIFLKM